MKYFEHSPEWIAWHKKDSLDIILETKASTLPHNALFKEGISLKQNLKNGKKIVDMNVGFLTDSTLLA